MYVQANTTAFVQMSNGNFKAIADLYNDDIKRANFHLNILNLPERNQAVTRATNLLELTHSDMEFERIRSAGSGAVQKSYLCRRTY